MSQPTQQRYQIDRRLDAGGMAEVFLARSAALEGFEKHVAIKRVLPNLVENKKFVRMFLDEARLSLHLNHANIVSVFDVGRAADSYFIVMEYVEGTNLKSILKKKKMPAPLAVYVILSVCKALAYAHTRKDVEGNSLDIVHRDVSPPNILLSWQGEVKLTDFGLARAASQIESTDPGIVKGKFAYLSPEAARGEPVDKRSDIFACGTVLWEAITGDRLFQGETDLKTVEKVRATEVPSLVESHGIPEELDQIINKALENDPDKRYQTARALGRDLAKYLVHQGESVTEYDLAEWLLEEIYSEDEEEPDEAGDSITSEAKQVEAELKQFVTLDEDLEIAAAYDAPEPEPGGGGFEGGHSLEDPRSWMVFEEGDENRGFFAQLDNTGNYKVAEKKPPPAPKTEDSPPNTPPPVEEPRTPVSPIAQTTSSPSLNTIQDRDVEQSSSSNIWMVGLFVVLFGILIVLGVFILQ
jgi:serine/threonine-protein kinase